MVKSHCKSAAFLLFMVFLFISCDKQKSPSVSEPEINESGYFEERGLNVLVFSNWYNDNFSDSKMSGVEIIHHGVRTVTNGDVRLSSTPAQWDPIPEFIERKINKENKTIEAFLTYPGFNFNYSVKAEATKDGILLSINIENPLPVALEGHAGFNLEFLPSAYFKKSYLMDENPGVFPVYPSLAGSMDAPGTTELNPLARGHSISLAPEDPERFIRVESKDNELLLFDGRNIAQNGWFVLRSLIPAGKKGRVVEWLISANTIKEWTRQPMIAYSQVGYHPRQKKTAIIEFDVNDRPLVTADVLKINKDGSKSSVFSGNIKSWGKYLRYNYYSFDFSEVKENGIYAIQYGNIITKTFRIDENIYEDCWYPSLDVFLPVQMDHMMVNEAYRVWHGASHLDDALQAPVNHLHFDLYAQGPTTDSPFKPGEHIPGLNTGGWYDAGDFDIRTQTNYLVVMNLVKTWESFGLKRDATTIDQKNRYVDIHVPDGKPDILQQVEHGTLALIAQHRVFNHAIPGIIEAHLSQYTHLGDAVTKTDNLPYNSELDSLESNGFSSGTFDDRWAFTSQTSALNYGSAAALAAASRVLKGYNDKLSEECISTAVKVWAEEHSHEPDTFRFGNTTGGILIDEELTAALELLITTGKNEYARRLNELAELTDFTRTGNLLVRAIPFMDENYKQKMKALVTKYAAGLDSIKVLNPFGVPVTTGGWAGNGWVVRFANFNYSLHKAFPDIIDKELVFSGLNYIYGCHPGSNISFVSGVGTESKMIAYGNNRADFSFIAGGVVPGALILPPDFPENKEDWPFLWGENEYVVNLASGYIYLVNAVNDLVKN